MMPGTEVKADTQPDDLTICDTLFVQYGQSINGVTGTATLTYENDGPVGQGPMLTLNNYTNRVEDFDGIYYDGDEILTIVLVGNNEITSTMNDGIMSYVPVMITGDGQLTVSANYSGFEGCGDNTLCVNRGQVTIKGNEYGVRANVSVSELAQLTAICGSEFEGIKGDVEVSGYAQVEATGGVGIRGKVRVASDNGKVIANGKYGIIGDVEARHGQVIATGENGIEGR